jgi:hypothetical protein
MARRGAGKFFADVEVGLLFLSHLEALIYRMPAGSMVVIAASLLAAQKTGRHMTYDPWTPVSSAMVLQMTVTRVHSLLTYIGSSILVLRRNSSPVAGRGCWASRQ